MSPQSVRVGCRMAVMATVVVTVMLTVVATLLTTVPYARAEGQPAAAEGRLRAQELLDRGNELFRVGDMRGALKVYREAYETFASPKLFFNIARCEENIEERATAMRDFTRFLADAPDAAAEARAEAQGRVRALTTVLTTIDIAGPPNAAVHLDGLPVGLTPLKGPLWVEPGLHNLAVQRAGGPPWFTSVVGRAGERVSLSVPDAPLVAPVAVAKGDPPPVPATTPPGDAPPRRWWLWTGIAAVLIGGGVTAFLVLRNPCPANKCE